MRKLGDRENMIPIDKRCMEKGISRRELARRSGVPTGTLEAWGNRTRVPRNVYQLLKVAQVLECHIEDLIEPEPDARPAER